MNISQSKLHVIMKAYAANPIDTKANPKSKVKRDYADKLSLSSDVKEFAKVLKLATQADDVRTQKVEELRHKINTGTYNIDGNLVAEKIIEQYFTDKRL